MINQQTEQNYIKRVGDLDSSSSVLTSSILSDINQIFYADGISSSLSSAMNLSVRYVTKDQYNQLVAGSLSDSFEPKTLYVTSSNIVDSSDILYSLVTPGEWEFSDGLIHNIGGPEFDGAGNFYYYLSDTTPNAMSQYFITQEDAISALSLTFNTKPAITATRTSLPNHLYDRAVNAVSVTSTETLTLPTIQHQGKSRDFYIKLTVTGSQTIHFSPSSGITYSGLGNPDKKYSEGSYLLHFTETTENTFNIIDEIDVASKQHVDMILASDFVKIGANAEIAESNDSEVSIRSIAIGKNADASNIAYKNAQAVALGAESLATGEASIAVGSQAEATGISSASGGLNVSIGYRAKANGKMSIAIGSAGGGESSVSANSYPYAGNTGSIAIGTNAKARAQYETIIGYGANGNPLSTGTAGTAFGASADASGAGAVAVGYGAAAIEQQSIAIGRNAKANALRSIAIGAGQTSADQTTALSSYSIAVGFGAKAEGERSIAIGGTSTSQGSIICKATASDAVQIGAGTNSTASSLQFKDYQLIDAQGKIPAERLNIDNQLLSTSINPVQNKVIVSALNEINDMLLSGFTEWEFSGLDESWTYKRCSFSEVPEVAPSGTWQFVFYISSSGNEVYFSGSGTKDSVKVAINEFQGVIATRRLITPKKTSQLSNDSGFITEQEISAKRDIDDLSYAEDDWFVIGDENMRLIRDNSVQEPNRQWTTTVDGVTWALLRSSAFWRFGYTGHNETIDMEESSPNAKSLDFEIDGNVYHLEKGTNLATEVWVSNEMRYSLVTPGEWTLSGLPEGSIYSSGPTYSNGTWSIFLDVYEVGNTFELQCVADEGALSLSYPYTDWGGTEGNSGILVATRASLPGHLYDRAINIVKPDVIQSNEWMWSNGETGTPTYSNVSSKWYVDDPSFTYDGPISGLSTDTELTFLSTETKVFTFLSFDLDQYEFNISVDNSTLLTTGEYDEQYESTVVKSIDYEGCHYILETPFTASSSEGSSKTGMTTIAEHVAVFTITYSPTVTLTMPSPSAGHARDLIVRIDLSQAVGTPPIAFSGGTFETSNGKMPELVKGVNLLSFTETDAGVFDVAHKEMKPIVNGGV